MVHKIFIGKAEVERTPQLDPECHRHSSVRPHQLFDVGFIKDGDVVCVTDPTCPVGDAVIYGGGIKFNGNVYTTPTIAAKYAKRMVEPNAEVANGWEFWAIRNRGNSIVKFSEILDGFTSGVINSQT